MKIVEVKIKEFQEVMEKLLIYLMHQKPGALIKSWKMF
jgi:hypothetical protein